MKKTVLFLILSFYWVCSLAQEKRDGNSSPFVSPKYSNDIVMQNDPGIDQRNVKISVAFNGWLYAAYSQTDAANNKGGIVIKRSKDDGATWQTMDGYFPVNYRYPALDIVVAGTDTNNLTLYLVAVNQNLLTNDYILFVDRYNATTGAFIGSNLNISKGIRRIYDVSIASDYLFPAVGASPYSIGIGYSVYSSSTDSINFVCSVDGGNSFTVYKNISTTGYYFRKISLAYGRSASASNGRYFIAWERLNSSTARYGNIFTSRNQSFIYGDWIPAKNLDSISSSMLGLCCNPAIAVQQKLTDNDSSSCTAVVLVERAYDGAGTDYDLLGFYNNRSHYTNNWFRLDIVNNSENDKNPHIAYDPNFDNFLTVYYDSTNAKLPYRVNNGNLTNPSTWTTISSQYNDQSNLVAAFPRVAINPVKHMVAHVWNAEGTGSNGIAMFDAEYSTIGINSNEEITGSIFPNPASDFAQLMINVNNPETCLISIYDINGKLVNPLVTKANKARIFNAYVDVKELSNGLYNIMVLDGNKVLSYKMVVSH